MGKGLLLWLIATISACAGKALFEELRSFQEA